MYKRYRVFKNDVESFLNTKCKDDKVVAVYVTSNDGKVDILLEKDGNKKYTAAPVNEDINKKKKKTYLDEIYEHVNSLHGIYSIVGDGDWSALKVLNNVMDYLNELKYDKSLKRTCPDFSCKIDLFGCRSESCSKCDYHSCRGCAHLYECILDDCEGLEKHIRENYTAEMRDRL